MQYTLNLTNTCNLSCSYCGLKQTQEFMSRETAFQAVDLALSGSNKSVGIGFYGGEPLLCKDLIYDIVRYTETNKSDDKNVFFKLTTNGLLLDDVFLEYAKQKGILISLSLDGNKEAHDTNRKYHSGKGTYESLLEIIPKLLSYNRYTSVMMTVAPNTAKYLYESVKSIYELGFISIICSIDYSAEWDEKDLHELKKQYKKLAKFYFDSMATEKKFFLSPFESKINSHIQHKEYCDERCKLGYEQISIAPDGTLYPCVQFVGDSKYKIGYTSSGIDQKRREEIFHESRNEQPECRDCAVKERCLHTCSCINKYSTGNLNKTSPALCAHERILIPIADSVAAKLYQKRNSMFIHKHYNELYPLISIIEDDGLKK